MRKSTPVHKTPQSYLCKICVHQCLNPIETSNRRRENYYDKGKFNLAEKKPRRVIRKVEDLPDISGEIGREIRGGWGGGEEVAVQDYWWWLKFLGVTVLLSLTVFQDSVSATMPITSLQIPLLGKKPNLRNMKKKRRSTQPIYLSPISRLNFCPTHPPLSQSYFAAVFINTKVCKEIFLHSMITRFI